MRVLFVSPAAGLGGAERCLLDCVAVLCEHGDVDVHVLALTDGSLLEEARKLGATTQVVPPPRGLALLGENGSGAESGAAMLGLLSATPGVMQFLARMRRAIANAKPDIVHTNGIKAHLIAGMLTPKRSHLVVHLHDFIGTRRASKWLLPALGRIRPQTTYIAISRAVARDFAGLAPDADVRTIHNVVDTHYFCKGAGDPDWLASLADLQPPKVGTVTFGLVATYARWKGHGVFLEAAGLLRKACPQIPLRFYVVGSPIYQTVGSQVTNGELLQRARDAGIASDFGLVPFQDDIARVYRALDVVVHSSTQPEPFGRTITEAMACARPILVARAGGAAELFEEGVNAFGFDPGNAAKLAEAMMRALDPTVRAHLAESARRHAVTSFGRSRLAHQLLQAYQAPPTPQCKSGKNTHGLDWNSPEIVRPSARQSHARGRCRRTRAPQRRDKHRRHS